MMRSRPVTSESCHGSDVVRYFEIASSLSGPTARRVHHSLFWWKCEPNVIWPEVDDLLESIEVVCYCTGMLAQLRLFQLLLDDIPPSVVDVFDIVPSPAQS